MKTTNYSKIAEKYDKNQYRVNEIRVDLDLKEYVDNNSKHEYQVLDLSCGTGLYLEKQINYFEGLNIKWTGLDLSEQMLNKANQKLKNVKLIRADVVDMPYASETLDFISNNYAFHHYSNKGKALDEIYRVLTRGGIYKLHNIAIHEMPNWWVYHYFPTAYYEDLKRFWSKDIIFNELTTRGLVVNLNIEYRMENVRVVDYIGYAENRDISVLTLINDKDYEEGLDRMRYDIKINPDKTIVNDFAEMFCIAKKL
ncbi:class I SAM-dependent methyltransferase [Anaerobacillus isosaccharinicus]|uniref:SAM-dependent methyltransferase n=1 Tax=Anaerobacillus isosaccharinicus TaxID=1532552 RepID=A0A1S2LVB2_9BACI|nr:class I SAM-dependent methyltransferase [Anaerobacillus isosaccharinicus]MBA5588418.1 class I SAM-dependent methyltransferase [Anaerobacillus isosaccharinicus]QOY38152.1 class I SAM-dependent methyltransferase [Anaerobacillus isosaccharinicus]